MAINIGPKIGIDGWSEFKSKIQTINASCRALKTEMDLVTESFTDNTTAQGKFDSVSAVLRKQLDAQNKKIAETEAFLERAAEEYGEGSREMQSWQAVLNTAKTEQVRLNKALDEAQRELDDYEDGVSDAADSMENAGDAAADFGDILKANLLSDAIMAGMQKLGELASDFASGMLEQAANLQAQSAQFTQTFGEMEKQARSSLQAVSEEAGISATRMQGSYTRIFAFAKTAGADSAEALTIAQRAMVVAADSAAYYDRSIEDVTESLQSFLKGNYANDAALGISATETTRNAKANEMYAQSFAKLSESQKVDVLLAMVEAGNKASGAIGQAARESDAWENVTGELNESWKMLQATVGKPVLKNTIPVLQKITASLNEVAESKKFEEFAEGLGNTLGWIVENGGTVVSVTASIGAGLLSMKVAMNAASYVEKFTGALNAMKLAMAANPWALAIGGATTLITLLATMPKQVSETQKQLQKSAEEVRELAKAADELKESISGIDEDFAKTRNELDSTAQIAERYLDKLEGLEKQNSLSEQAQAEYNKTVELLKTLLPDVNIHIDEQTGLLQGGAKALRSNIAAWKELAVAQAYQKRMQQSTEALVDAQENLLEQQKKMGDLTWQKQQIEAHQAMLKTMQQTGKITWEEYSKAWGKLSYTLNNKDGINAQIAELTTGMSENESVIDSNAKKLDEYAEKAGLAANETEQLSGAIADADAQSFINLQKAYNDLKNAARDSVDSQVGAFDELSMKTDWTFDKILQNIESQNRAFSQYSDNLKKAMERGIDEGLIQTLSDGSEESMRILDVLVNGTDEEIDRLADAMQLNREQRARLAASIADATKSADAEWRKAAKDAENAGMDIVNGAISGIKQKTQEYLAAIRGLASAGQRQYRLTNEIKSPSRKFRRLAEYDVEGLIAGWQEKAAALKRTVAVVAGGMAAPFHGAITLPELGNYRVSVPAGRYTAGNVLQKTVNLGGISITIAATDTAKIQNAEQLAELVSRKISAEAERIVAANG